MQIFPECTTPEGNVKILIELGRCQRELLV